jgi:hypothetical protein
MDARRRGGFAAAFHTLVATHLSGLRRDIGMVSEPTCAFCEQPPTAYCRRCGRPYCDAHGGAFCHVCLDPAASLPSPRLFQVALWGLPICAALGLWFLFATPRLPGERPAGPSESTASQLGGATSVPLTATRASTPSSSATAATRNYTVKAGDTLQSVANANSTTVQAIEQLNPTVDANNLQVGQVLHLPSTTPTATP